MTYEEIYSQFYSKETDSTFFKKYSKDEAYDLMRSWLHQIIGEPYVRKCFSSISLDDEILELTFQLRNPVNDNSDNCFVKNIFAQGLKICWMTKEVDHIRNMAVVVGGKEEKTLLNNYKHNKDRLESLEIKLRKTIRDYGYINNDYIGEE